MENETSSRKLELVLGLLLAVFAALLAINDLGAGKYGDDEMVAHNKQTEAYNWYQSKSMKQSISEGQRDMLNALVTAGAISAKDEAGVDTFIVSADAEIARYKKEKKEILLGSDKVGKENWAQEKDGEMGQITGAEEWADIAEKLGKAGDLFDMATLFLQLCIVLGAVGLVLQDMKTRKFFVGMMLFFGLVGAVYTIFAYMAAMAVGA
jgi:hypothetical protein